MLAQVVDGDLLEQPVDVIVNAWNRNIIPWWLLLPQGVSGAIKKRAGIAPFVEVGRKGAIMWLASNMFWRASRESIQGSVIAAMAIVETYQFASVAFPVVGAGSGGYSAATAIELMEDSLTNIAGRAAVTIVRFRPGVMVWKEAR
jgi:O-acetyl-ADP-ribose deacetylase